MRLIRTRLLGLLSAIVLAIPAFAFAQPGYLCRMTGQISASCCCSAEHVSKHCGAELTRGSCCQLIEADRTLAPSAAPDTSRAIAAAFVVAVLDRLPAAPAECAHPRELTRVAHPPGPPRFLVKCSFLI